jgi:hypothetical protein
VSAILAAEKIGLLVGMGLCWMDVRTGRLFQLLANIVRDQVEQNNPQSVLGTYPLELEIFDHPGFPTESSKAMYRV